MVTSPKKQAAERKPSAVEQAKSWKRYIHLADGNKGGVGKSVLARTLYAVLLDLGTPVIGVEADIDSPDFKGIYTDVQVSCFSEDEKANEQACSIINWAIEDEKNIVVNLPATVHKAFQLWVEQFDIIDLAASHDVGLVKWFICTGEYDSMKSLQVSLETFGEKIPHVVVKNLKYDDWEFFETDERTQALIKQYACPVIELPKIPGRLASTLLQERLTFEAALTHRGNNFGIVQQSAIRGYLKKAKTAFQATGLV